MVGTLTCRTVAMPLSSHTTAGAGQLGTLLRSQPQRGRQEVCGPVPTGALDAIGLQTRGVYGRFNKSEGCVDLKSDCPSRTTIPATNGRP